MRLFLALTVATGMVLPSSPSFAIVRRHDVSDLQYQNYGRQFRAPLVNIAIPNPHGAPQLHNGMGVLIAPNWVLTAAHAAEIIKPGTPKNPTGRYSVYVGGLPRLIDGVFINPGWKQRLAGEDIALIRLKEPVSDTAPVGLYDGKDELGKTLIVAGYGAPGTGKAGVGKHDAILRAANVTVDEVDSQSLGWTFRSPKTRGVHALEGISGPGDSGGPALLERNGQLFVVGVSSTQDRKGQQSGTYGVVEYYARVSALRPWIEKVMAENARPAPAIQ